MYTCGFVGDTPWLPPSHEETERQSALCIDDTTTYSSDFLLPPSRCPIKNILEVHFC